MLVCCNCGKQFPNRLKIEGKTWNLTKRRFCPECSPLGKNNRRTHIVAVESDKAFCARCQKIKDRTEFHNRKNGRPLSYCRTCSKEVKELKLQEKLEKAVTLKGGICADCGCSFPTPVFVFISDKQALLLGQIKLMSWERFKKDLENYEMLCRNCVVLRKWEAGDV